MTAPAIRDASLDELAEMFRRTPLALAVVDLTTSRLSSVNSAFAELLQLDLAQANGLDLLSLVPTEDRGVAERVLAGVASGIIDSCQGRGRWQVPQGKAVEVVASLRPLDAVKPRARALVVAASADGAPLGEPWLATLDAKRVAFGVVDHDWRFIEMSADAADLFDWDVRGGRGTPLQAIVHPDDVAVLLLTLGRSGADRRAAATRLRVRATGGGWAAVRLAVSPLCDHNPSRFAVALWFLPPGEDAEPAADRASRLEDHLWRIAVEVQAAQINDPPRSGQSWWADPALRGLSRRQSEILRRLTQGQRVAVIARELFLNESTVRNHLSAIYRKVGVHSQSELLARLMPGGDTATE
jgi:DNA-binding CsgD family transcriptional regulator/PAS domain-containing protein